jgi:NAD-dependent dihydropyrimidine dehydrogenase PreA subunit
MIMAEGKPIEEIIGEIKDLERVLVAGCDGCVTVCEAGGLKEVQVLASALRMYFTQQGKPKVIDEVSLTRQCDKDYLRTIQDRIGNYDCVVSLACGAGVQFMAEMYKDKLIFPGVDTRFIGVTEERGVWTERCQACGQCILASTGGICPIARCSKRMLNGPCGGSEGGKCEVSKEIPCGWQLIYDRLKELGQLDRFEHPMNPKDWTTSRDGGPRKIIKEVSRI